MEVRDMITYITEQERSISQNREFGSEMRLGRFHFEHRQLPGSSVSACASFHQPA